MNAFYVACLISAAAFLAWSATFGVSALLRSFDETPLKQPDGAQPSEVDAPPTFDFAPSGPSAVRCRRTLMFGALYPDISVGPLQEAS